MALTITDATTYIDGFVIDNVDWDKADDKKKQRILNVAQRTLQDWADIVLPPLVAVNLDKDVEDVTTTDYTVPDDAVYEFSAVLSRIFNDTNKLAAQGVAGFSVTGVGSFTFKNAASGPSGRPLSEYFTDAVLRLIDKANDVRVSGRIIKDVII